MFVKRFILKIKHSNLINIPIKIFIIILIPTIIIISFLYSSNFNLLEHSYTLIKGNSFYYDEELLSKIHCKKSLLEIEPKIIQNQLNQLEYIESAKVSKIFPNTIFIEVIENIPLLYFKNNNDLIILDYKETILPVNDKVKQFFDIPIIILNNQQLNNSNLTKINLNLFQEIISTIKYSKINFNSFYSDLKKIIILDNHYELFYMDKTKIFISKNNAKEQLKYLSIFKDTVKEKRLLENYLYIDMRIENQIIVKENKLI